MSHRRMVADPVLTARMPGDGWAPTLPPPGARLCAACRFLLVAVAIVATACAAGITRDRAIDIAREESRFLVGRQQEAPVIWAQSGLARQFEAGEPFRAAALDGRPEPSAEHVPSDRMVWAVLLPATRHRCRIIDSATEEQECRWVEESRIVILDYATGQLLTTRVWGEGEP